MILVYIKKLFGKWFALIGAFLTILSFTETYIEFPFSIPSEILYIVAIIAYIYASYQVWHDMKKEKEKLEEKLKNPVDYEVKAYVKKVVFDLEYLENKININIEQAEKIIYEICEELKELQEKPDQNSLSSDLKILNSLGINKDSKYRQMNMLSISELNNYLKELKNYSSKKNECLNKYKEVIENQLKDLYMVDFVILNCGIKFDEDIDIILEFGEKNKFLGEEYIYLNIPKCDLLPNKPERKTFNDFIISKPIFNNDFNLIGDSNPLIYKRYEEIEEEKFSIKLRDLKVSKCVRIFKNDSYLFKIEDNTSIKCTITSKNSTEKIIKNVIFENDGEIEYFKDILNGVEK